MSILNKMNSLANKLDEANRSYYIYDTPIMSDVEYDQVFRELQQLEEENPSITITNSPIKTVGARIEGGLKPVVFERPMLSLDNSFNEEEIDSFCARVKEVTDSPYYYLDEKMDGIAISLTYRYGVLTMACTRGDGMVGDDITHNVETIRTGLPTTIESLRELPLLEIRGEGVIPRAALRIYNKRLIENGKAPYINARNAASGAFRKLDPKKASIIPLAFFAYDISTPVRGLSSQAAKMDFLVNLGFNIPKYTFAEDAAQIVNALKVFETKRHDTGYDTDGVVIKVDSLAVQYALGNGERSPKWATSYKFEAEEHTTTCTDVVYQVGRTGIITPVATLESVFVSGVTITSATLTNRFEMHAKGARIGARCFVRRAGEVIPEITGFIEDESYRLLPETIFPDNCPSCGTLLVTGDMKATLCPNTTGCKEQLIQTLTHLTSRDCLYIKGIGNKTATVIVEKGLFKTVNDLSSFTTENLVSSGACGLKDAMKIMSNLNKAFTGISLAKAIQCLLIPNIGKSMSSRLATVYGSIEGFLNQEGIDLCEVENAGETLEANFNDFITDERFKPVLEWVKTLDIANQRVVDDETLVLAGHKFVFTGTFINIKRSVETEELRELGANVSGNVHKDTVLVVGLKPGSKLKAAQKLGCTILTESEYVAAGYR